MSESALQHWIDAFAARDRRAEPAWVEASRRAALASLAKRGFPTRKDEDWKYINPEGIVAGPWVELAPARPAANALAALALAPTSGCVLTFVNGRYAPELSRRGDLAPGVRAAPWSQLREDEAPVQPSHTLEAIEEHPFALLAAAQFEDGLRLRIPPHTPDTAVTALFLTMPADAAGVSQPRLSVVLGDGSHLRLREVHAALGEAPYFKNFLAEFEVGDGALCQRLKLQAEAEPATHLATVAARVCRGGRFENHTLSWGGRVVREELLCNLAGEGAAAVLNGLYATRAEQQSDHHTIVDHAVPGCTSRQRYRGVLTGKSRAAFSGRVIVRPDAQQSDAEQRNENLLLSEGAEADSKPQLEIYADDVRCSHGATIGQLDPEQIFYLRSRGLDEANSRAILTRGFVASITTAIDDEPLRERVEATLVERLFAPPGGAT